MQDNVNDDIDAVMAEDICAAIKRLHMLLSAFNSEAISEQFIEAALSRRGGLL
jgi:hypothetical protein